METSGPTADQRVASSFAEVPVSAVRDYWNARPCNIRHSTAPVGSLEYSNEVEARKYLVEPHIPSFAQFDAWKGARVLEVGCGIGTDTINFARAGARVVACDLSAESIKVARQRAESVGVADRITFVETDAESMAGVSPAEPFDLVYSFGVVHHSPHPDQILEAMRARVRTGGRLKLMVYNRHSWKVAGIVLVAGGQAWKADELIARSSEAQTGCPVTYTYTRTTVKDLVEPAGFHVDRVEVDHIFPYRVRDYVEYQYVKRLPFRYLPAPAMRQLERRLGWHLMVDATAR